ncbi:MAG: chorismate mutase [Proteobacteria bacterium]|nr:chorismate mutase [Pseudomonadota bacterium]
MRVMESLKPYRAQIDVLDEQIVKLLIDRFKIVRSVAELKARENIAVVQSNRAEEVKTRVSAMAEAGGLDGTLLRNIYTLMIDHAHVIEDEIVADRKKREK